MKLLKKVRLINWHSYANTTVEINGRLATINGLTGVGKSTLYDALMYVLTCTDANFNKAANQKSKRSVEGYVRYKIGTETRKYLREGVVVGHVALEFQDERTGVPFIVGAVIDSKSENDTKTWWYKIDNKKVSDELFIRDNKPMDRMTFESMNPNAEMYKEPSEARRRLINKLGRFGDKFHDMLAKAIAFKPIDRVEDFITTFLLDEKNVNVQLLKENVRTFQDLETMVIKTKAQIEKLKGIESKYENMSRIKDNMSIQKYILKRASLEEIDEVIDDLLVKIENGKDKERELIIEINKISQEIVEYTKKIRELDAESKSGDTKVRLDALLDELKKVKLEKERVDIEVESIDDMYRKICVELDNLMEVNKSLGTDVSFISDIKNSIAEYKESSDISKIYKAISDYQVKGKDIRSSQFTKRAELLIEKKELHDKVSEVDKRIKDLENRNLNYSANVNLLLEEIKKDFKNANKNDEPKVLCELLEIVDEDWQNAIEGYLNTQRFYILVAPENFNLAVSTYEKLRKTHKLHSVGIINAAGLDHYSNCESGSLATVVTSKNKYAKCFINKLLNKVVLCESEKELKKYSTSITKTCMVYKNNVVKGIDPRIYKSPYIGAEAYKVQLAQSKEELASLNERYKLVNTELNRVNESISVLDSDKISEFSSKLHFIQNQKEIGVRLNDLIKEEEELKKDRTLMDIMNKLKHYEELLQSANEERDMKIAQKGSVEGNRKRDMLLLEAKQGQVDKYDSEFTAYKNEMGDLVSDAEVKYDKEINSRGMREIKSSYEKRLAMSNAKLSTAREELVIEMYKYKEMYNFGAEASLAGYFDFKDELEKLTVHKLHKYEEDARNAKESAELEFKEQFLSKVRENIKIAQTEIERINRVLRRIEFGTDRYEFKWSPSKKFERYYKMIMNEFNLLGNSLFSEHFNQEQKEVIKELFDKLSVEDIDEKTKKEFTDYRTYMDYDIKITHEDGSYSLFSKVNNEKSGGETQSPFYATILSSFVQLYSQSIGGIEDSIGLVLLDEAFNNMDEYRVKGVLEFMGKLPLQVLIASPADKVALIQPYVDDTIIVYKDSKTKLTYAKTFEQELWREENVL